MGWPLRSGVLLVVVLASALPLAALGYVELQVLGEASDARVQAESERQALLAAVRADAAAARGEDPVVAAAEGAPAGTRVRLVGPDGAWRDAQGGTGHDPGLGQRVRAATSGAEGTLAWARAPGADGVVVLSLPPPATGLQGAERALAAVAVFSILGAAVVAVLLTERVVGPVRRLERAAAQLARGDFEARAPDEGSREIRSLARAFNAMAADLRHQHAELQAVAEERRRTLADTRETAAALNFTVAHELREPVRSMRTAADLVLEDPDPEDAVAAMRMLRDRLTFLERVLLDMLRFEEAASRPMPVEPVDLRALAERAVARVREEGHALDASVGPLPRVRGDAQLLEEAFAEVLRNVALHGGGRALVGGRAESGGAVVRVDDAGPGIPAARREEALHLFQRFRSDAPGTGHGLALVRLIARRHDGDVALLDAPEGGLRVELRLPALGPAPRAAPPEVEARRY